MATNLDSQYMLAPAIQQLFRDKDTGLPLANGKVYFYRDISRNELKTVYKLSGTPGSYTYVALENPVILNAVGAFEDAIYYFPYDESEQNPTTIDLYYVKWYNEDDIEQGDRQAWPNFITSSSNEDTDFNFITNGQFILHSDLQKSGLIANASTVVAPGGWTFERPSASTATDYVTFNRINSYSEEPEGNPRYKIRLRDTDPGVSGDDIKDLRIKFNNVNRFASDDQQYTFRFYAANLLDGTVPVNMYIYKNFGSGGSPDETIQIGVTEDVGTGGDYYNAVFVFGDNSGKTIGTADDDYVSLIIRMPGDVQFDAEFTDISLLQGNKATNSFPTETTRQDIYGAIAGGLPIPAYDGTDLYLPIMYTSSGFSFDYSVIGTINATVLDASQIQLPWKYCDGSTLRTLDYSGTDANSIPYARLEEYLWTGVVHKYGNGLDYSTVFSNLGLSELLLYNNRVGTVSAVAVGSGLPSFVFTTIHTSTDYYINSYMIDNATLYAQVKYLGDLSPYYAPPGTVSWGPGDSGFGVSRVRENDSIDESYPAYPNPSVAQTIFTITPVADSSGSLAGKYFLLESYDSDFGTATKYYMWFKVSGVGVDPAVVDRTGILCNLATNDTDTQVTQKVCMALNGFQATMITVSAASAITGGDYFTFESKTFGGTQNYYVWYKKDGVGADPAPGGIGIEIDISSADTSLTVTTTTLIDIQRACFALPDMRGRFLRGLDSALNPIAMDRGIYERFSYFNIFSFGPDVGTEQYSDNISHAHHLGIDGPLDVPMLTTEMLFPGLAQTAGIYESRPVNIAVNYMIHL